MSLFDNMNDQCVNIQEQHTYMFFLYKIQNKVQLFLGYFYQNNRNTINKKSTNYSFLNIKKMNKSILLFGEEKMGKTSLIATLSHSKASPTQKKHLEVTKIIQEGVNYHFIDSFSKTSFFEDDDYPFILSSQLEDLQQLKPNDNYIDAILLFQSVAESTIQMNLTIQELKHIFPTLENDNLIVVITKWERSQDQQKLNNLIKTLTNKNIRFIQWINSCSDQKLTNEEYQKFVPQQKEKLFSLIQKSERIQLRQSQYSERKRDQIANEMAVKYAYYDQVCQQFGQQQIKISQWNENNKIYVIILFCILAIVAQLSYDWEGTLGVLGLVLIYNLYTFYEAKTNEKQKQLKNEQILELSKLKVLNGYEEIHQRFVAEKTRKYEF